MSDEKKKVEIDWKITGMKEVYDDNPMLKGFVNFHTHGLNNHGCIELSVVTMLDVHTPEYVCGLINTVGKLMVGGDKFDPDRIHNIWDNDGNLEYKFWAMETKCFNEKSLRLILPDKNGKFVSKELLESEDDGLDPWQFEMLHCFPLFIEQEKKALKHDAPKAEKQPMKRRR